MTLHSTTFDSPRRPAALAAALAAAWRTATGVLETWLAPFLDLAIRLWMARVFFTSGLTKIQDWQSTLFLFKYEYDVPLLPTEVAAVLGTTFELGLPVLLVLGLFTRLAAVPLLVMAMVIQFALGAANPAYNHIEHCYWMFLLLTIILHGPGRLSLDDLIGRRFGR